MAKFAIPTDPKQRQQIMIAGVLMAIIVIVLLVMFVINPHIKKKQEKLDALAALEQQIAKATHDTQNLTKDRQANYEYLRGIIEDVVTPYFIQSELNSYILPAERILKQVISEAGINRADITIQEQGVNDFMMTPGVNNDKTVISQCYSVQVSIKCSYNKLIKVLEHLQESNPYIAITALSISSLPQDFRNHQIGFQVQWPTWRNSELQTKIQTNYKAAKAAQAQPVTGETPTEQTPALGTSTNAPVAISNAVPEQQAAPSSGVPHE